MNNFRKMDGRLLADLFKLKEKPLEELKETKLEYEKLPFLIKLKNLFLY